MPSVIQSVSLGSLSSTQEYAIAAEKSPLHRIALFGHFEHCQTIFQCLGKLTVYGQYVFNQLSPAHQGNRSAYDKRQDVHTCNTQEAGDLNIPQCNLTKSQKCFPVSANCNQAL